MNEDFSEKSYLESNADVAAAVKAGQFTLGWEHYEKYGRLEGRSLRLQHSGLSEAMLTGEQSKEMGHINPFPRFEQRRPSAQTAVDVFGGRWASDLTPVLGVTGTGHVPLFQNAARPQEAAKTLAWISQTILRQGIVTLTSSGDVGPGGRLPC